MSPRTLLTVHRPTLLVAILMLLLFSVTQADDKADLRKADEAIQQIKQLVQDRKLSEAISLATDVLRTRERILGSKNPRIAGSLGLLAGLFTQQGDFATAIAFRKRALSILDNSPGDLELEAAIFANDLAELYRQVGEFDLAEPLYQRSLKTIETKFGNSHLNTAAIVNNLASLHMDRGDPAAALPLYKRSLTIHEGTGDPDSPALAMNLRNLTVVYRYLGDKPAAKSFGERSLKTFNKIRPDHPDTALILNELALLYSMDKDFEKAEPLLQRSLEINEKYYGRDSLAVAASLNELAVLYSNLKQYPEAEERYKRSLKIREKLLNPNHRDIAMSLNNLATLYNREGNDTAAEPLYQRSLKINETTLGTDHPDTVFQCQNLAAFLADNGRWSAAADLTDRSRRGVRRYGARVLPTLSDRNQLQFLRVKDVAQLDFALALGWARRSDPAIVARSAAWLLNGKAVAQAALAERSLQLHDLNDPQLAGTVKELANIRQQLALLALRMPETGQENTHRGRLQSLTDKEESLARRLAEGRGRPTDAEPWIELEALRKSLQQGSMLVDIVRFYPANFPVKSREQILPAHYVAWVTPPAEQGEMQIIDLGLADAIDDAVAAVRNSINAGGGASGEVQQQGERIAEEHMRADLQRLADLVWKPLADKVGDAKRLIISPDASLWLLPWGALPIGNDKLLIEQYALEHVVSGRDIVAAAQKRDHSRQNPPVIFANPAFDMTAPEVKRKSESILGNVPMPDEDSAPRALTQLGKSALPKAFPLPGTQVEAQAITAPLKSLSGTDPQVYVGRNALEIVFKAVHRPKIVIVSTHGFFLPDQEVQHDDNRLAATEARALPPTVDGQRLENPLLRCGLLLSGCNNPGSGGTDDGVLTGLEIVGLDLRQTELVVLSACETGVGVVRNGEGVAGLRQAFQLAGAEAVVATLWQIPDAQSARLMTDFFTNLAAGQSKTDALRHAQLKMIEYRREKFGAAHPFFWAAFTITGQ